MSSMTDFELAALRAGVESMPEIEERPLGRIRVWGEGGILLLQRPIKSGDRLPHAAHAAVAAARNLWPGDPRHVSIDVGGERTVRVIDGPFLRDPMEFVSRMVWPTNPLLSPSGE